MAAIIDIALLQRYAKDYDNTLRTLPFFAFTDIVSKTKLNVLDLTDKDVIVNFRRKAGNTGPYKIGQEITYPASMGKMMEMFLEPELTVTRVKDNILNYKDKRVLTNAGEKVDLITKKHPLEKMIVDNMIISHLEDIAFQLFHGDRNDDVFSTATAFTGYFPLIDGFMASNDIREADGNLHITGEFAQTGVDADDINDYDRLVDFVKDAHPLLRVNALLYISSGTAIAALAGYRAKVNNFDRPKMADMWSALNDDALANVTPIIDNALGTGNRLTLTKPGLFDLGINSKKAQQFVQIRNIYEDPHEVQFWMECAYGTRVQDIHKKLFLTNEQKNTAIVLAGDY
jgi:hypothetical protein